MFILVQKNETYCDSNTDCNQSEFICNKETHYCIPKEDPTITGIYPNSITVGAPVSLTIKGANFGSSGTLRIADRDIPQSDISITNTEINVKTEGFLPSTPTCTYMNLQYTRDDNKSASRANLLRSKRSNISIIPQESTAAQSLVTDIAPQFATTLYANNEDNFDDILVAGINKFSNTVDLRYLIKRKTTNFDSQYDQAINVFTNKETTQITPFRQNTAVGSQPSGGLIEYGREKLGMGSPSFMQVYEPALGTLRVVSFPSGFKVNDIHTGIFTDPGRPSPDVIAVSDSTMGNPTLICFDLSSINTKNIIETQLFSETKILPVVIGDLNNDRFDDFITIMDSSVTTNDTYVFGYHRVGPCTFEKRWKQVATGKILLSKIIDLNGDKYNDILLVTDRKVAYTWFGNNTGVPQFKETTIDIGPSNRKLSSALVDTADMDCDNIPDIITTQIDLDLIDYFETIPTADGVTFKKHQLKEPGIGITPISMTIQKFNDPLSQNRIILLSTLGATNFISLYLTGSTP